MASNPRNMQVFGQNKKNCTSYDICNQQVEYKIIIQATQKVFKWLIYEKFTFLHLHVNFKMKPKGTYDD